VIGVSPDPVDSHARFKEQLGIPFRLISDPNGDIASAYDARRRIGPKTRRITYIIDSAGMIVDAFQHELRIRKNVELTLTALKSLS
jgi:peroxiredoxin Q/BCP